MSHSLDSAKDRTEKRGLSGPSLVQLLTTQLSDTIDLRSQTRQAHFNVKGPFDQKLSAMFDGLAGDLRQFADLIAQRITSLGGQPVATVRFVAGRSTLREYPRDASRPRDHLSALLSAYTSYESNTLKNMKEAERIGDRKTSQLLRFLLTSIEKHLWFLEAALESCALGVSRGRSPVWFSAFVEKSGRKP